MCCSEKADSSGQIRAAEASEKVGMRSLDLTEQHMADQRELQEEFLDMIRVNSETDGALKDLQMELALDQSQRRQDIFDPLEASLVLEAEEYDSPERMANEMGKADAAVVQAYDKAARTAARDQLRLGINPNSGKALAMRENAQLGTAKAAATASTAAGERVKARGFGMRMDAAGLGRNLVSNQTAAADSAVRAGQSGVQGMQSGVDQANRNFGSGMQGFGTATSAFSSAGNIYGDIAQRDAETGAANAQGMGQLAGAGLMLL